MSSFNHKGDPELRVLDKHDIILSMPAYTSPPEIMMPLFYRATTLLRFYACHNSYYNISIVTISDTTVLMICPQSVLMPTPHAGILLCCCATVCCPGYLHDYLQDQGVEPQGSQGDNQKGCHWINLRPR